MSDNMGGLDTFDVGYTAAKAKCSKELSAMKQRAEAAEARIKASQEQRPYGYLLGDRYYRVKQRDDAGFGEFYPGQKPIYEAPVIPTDVAELLRKLDGSETLRRQYFVEMCDVIEKNEELMRKLGEQQAEIDRLMLEYCPDEMTSEQVETWAKHQIPVDAETQALIDSAAAPQPETDIDQAQRFK